MNKLNKLSKYAPATRYFGLFVAVALAFTPTIEVFAVSVTLPGRTINVDQNGSNVNIQYPGGQELNVTTGNNTLNVNIGGQNIQVQTNDGLDVQVSRGALGKSAMDAIVSLQGGTDALIRSDSDLNSYKQLVLENCSGLKTISTPGATVEVQYTQPARFLGIFSSDLNGTVQVSADGNVAVTLPWYAFLFRSDSNQIAAQIKADVSADQAISVSSGDSSVQIRRSAHIINVVTSAVSVNTDGCTTTVHTASSPAPSYSPSPTPALLPAAPSSKPSAPQATSTSSAQPSSTVAQFAGEWNGSYTPNSLTGPDCKPGGSASLSVSSNGSVIGYAINKGVKVPGTGTVNNSGHFSGTWSYSGLSASYSGTLNSTTNTGSGTYKDNFGCFGSFSLRR